jgi:hypothetical protein
MIYSKFGTPLVLISKTESPEGRVMIQAAETASATDIHEYAIADLKADNGIPEIREAVAALQAKVFGNTDTRRRRRRGLD